MSDTFSIDSHFTKKPKKRAIPLRIVDASDYPGWLEEQPARTRGWLESTRFRAAAGRHALIPGPDGSIGEVLLTVTDPEVPWDYATLPRDLPKGNYVAPADLPAEHASALCLGWALGSYRFERYKTKTRARPTLAWPDGADQQRVTALAEGTILCRDLINTPAADMGPVELSAVGHQLAKLHGGKYRAIAGERLVREGYPAIYAVGKASSREPVFFDLRWGKARHPRVTLVGKGVCFDTGGLDLKPSGNMRLMKKDMGGAALVLGLAHVIMALELPIQLRVLVPAVENSVSGNAFRPLDVLDTRKGITVEVGNTDAEGRLVLCDALAEAENDDPDLVIDVATLTGAARVALGTSMPALFATKEDTAAEILAAGLDTHDPLWRMPLHQPYRRMLDSKVADIINLSNSPYAGAITAALFLAEFVSKDRDWVHIDTMGYNVDTRPGRPVGGEALGLLALTEMLQRRFGGKRAPAKADSTSVSSGAPDATPSATAQAPVAADAPRAASPAKVESESPPKAPPPKAPPPKKKATSTPAKKRPTMQAAKRRPSRAPARAGKGAKSPARSPKKRS